MKYYYEIMLKMFVLRIKHFGFDFGFDDI